MKIRIQHANTVERKATRQTVALAFREQLVALRESGDRKAQVKFVREWIRPILPFSEKTVDTDIFCSMFSTLRKMKDKLTP